MINADTVSQFAFGEWFNAHDDSEFRSLPVRVFVQNFRL